MRGEGGYGGDRPRGTRLNMRACSTGEDVSPFFLVFLHTSSCFFFLKGHICFVLFLPRECVTPPFDVVVSSLGVGLGYFFFGGGG